MNTLKINLSAKLFSCFLVIAFCFCAQTSFAQQSAETKRGVELYNQGNDKEAIVTFKQVTKKNKRDVEAWYYLGLAYEHSSKSNDASKAYDNAAEQGIELFVSQFDDANTEDKVKEVIQNTQFLISQIELAIKSSERYRTLNPNLSGGKLEKWQNTKDMLESFVSPAKIKKDNGSNIYPQTGVTTKAVITYKPQPEYSGKARDNGIEGVVRISAILGADGKVHSIRPITVLPYGLTANSIKTTLKLKFRPAMKDGKLVSQYVTLEYNFRIY